MSTPYGLTPTRGDATYELGLWQRTPNQIGPPTFVEVGRIVSPTITWSDTLAGGGRLDCSTQPDRLDTDVRAALARLSDKTTPQGCELRLVRNGTTIWAGPIPGGGIQGRGTGTLTLTAHSLGYYLRGMRVVTDLNYSATDQYTIGKNLVDQWQAIDWYHMGIDTSGIGLSGTTRARTYLADELPDVHEKLSELADVDGGFDWWIDPATRALTFGSRGSDLSASIVLDWRNIADAGINFDTAAGAFGTVAIGVGTSADHPPVRSTRVNQAALESFGGFAVAQSIDGVSEQATLDAHVTKLVDDYSVPTFLPGPKLIPITDADVGDFGPGDVLGFSFDAGLGLQEFTRRVGKVQTSVDDNGAEAIAVEFT